MATINYPKVLVDSGVLSAFGPSVLAKQTVKHCDSNVVSKDSGVLSNFFPTTLAKPHITHTESNASGFNFNNLVASQQGQLQSSFYWR